MAIVKWGRRTSPKDLILNVTIESIITANDADQSRMRWLLSHAFLDKALRAQESLIQSYVNTLIEKIKGVAHERAHGKADISLWFNYLTFDVMGDIFFSVSFDSLKNSRYHPWASIRNPQCCHD